MHICSSDFIDTLPSMCNKVRATYVPRRIKRFENRNILSYFFFDDIYSISNNPFCVPDLIFSDCLQLEIIAYLIMSNKSVAQNTYFYLHSHPSLSQRIYSLTRCLPNLSCCRVRAISCPHSSLFSCCSCRMRRTLSYCFGFLLGA